MIIGTGIDIIEINRIDDSVQRFGNAFLDGTTRNFNTVMATAADTVILEPEEITDEPLNPAEITIPGIFIDYIATEDK